MAQARERVSKFMSVKQTYRSHAQVSRFFAGMRLVPPGVVRVSEWRASAAESATPSALWGGVGRKG